MNPPRPLSSVETLCYGSPGCNQRGMILVPGFFNAA